MIVALFTLLLASGSALAAPFNATLLARGCAAHKDQAVIASDEQRFRAAWSNIASINDVSALATATIPVVWHVIQKSETLAGGKIPDNMIKANIDAMNDHYGPSGISFELTKTTRTTNAGWFSGVGPDDATQTAMKKQLREGDAATLNIYTVGFESGSGQGLLGYATFPSDYESNPKDDGVVLLHSSVPGGASTNYDEGKTLTHEVGHWLGLYHVFQGGCSGEGDMVSDTPPQETATSGCPTSQDSCPGGGVDLVHNFMDYSYDACMDSFTTGQITRAKQQILTYRQITVGNPTSPTTSEEPTETTEEPTETEVPSETEVPTEPTETIPTEPTESEEPTEPFPTEEPTDPTTTAEDPTVTDEPTEPEPEVPSSSTKTRTRTRSPSPTPTGSGGSDCPWWFPDCRSWNF